MKSLAFAALFVCACGGFIERETATSTLRILESSQVAARRLGDVDLARDALAGGIVQLAAFELAFPNEPRFAALHADAVCDYAQGFVFDAWEDATLAKREDEVKTTSARLDVLLGECIALEAARLPKGWTIATLRSGDVPAALAIGRAKAVKLALAPMAMLGELPSLRELLERCATLRPGFHDGDAELLLGIIATQLAKFLPGNEGEVWFQRAAARAGDGVLMVALVRAHATGATDELQRIANADLSRWPEHRLANALAVRKARRYLMYP